MHLSMVVAALLAFAHACIASAPPVQLIAGGSSLAAALYQKLSVVFSIDVPEVSITYAPLGSSKGTCRLQNYSTQCAPGDSSMPQALDWAGSDSIFNQTDYAAYPDLQLLPAFAAPVVAIYNLPGVSDLILPPLVLARIFRQCAPGALCPSSSITYWNDSQIVGANLKLAAELTAAHVAYGAIKLFVRADGSGTTEIFKNSLNIFEPLGFGQQVFNTSGDPSAALWTNVSVSHVNTNLGVAGAVLSTPGSIGYTSLDIALALNLQYAAIGKSVLSEDGILRATETSVSFALAQQGFDFGSIPSDPVASHLTTICAGATGSEAWPILGFSYMAVRLNTTRSGASCASRLAVLQWLQWFYNSSAAQVLIASEGMGVLPVEARRLILFTVLSKFTCNGKLIAPSLTAVAQPSNGVPVSVLASEDAMILASLYGHAMDEFNSINFNATLITKTSVAQFSACSLLGCNNLPWIMVVDSIDAKATQASQPLLLPFAALAWGVTFNLCDPSQSTPCSANSMQLSLTPDILAQILSGTIGFWDHALLQAQSSAPMLLPHQAIKIVGYQPGSGALARLELLLQQRFNMSLTLATPTLLANSTAMALTLVGATRYSMTVAPLSSAASVISGVASFQSSSPNEQGVLACVDTSAAQEDLTLYQSLASSTKSGCWPLVEPYFLLMPQTKFSAEDCLSRVPQASIFYAASFLANNTVPPSLEGFFLLPSKTALNALGQLNCFGRSISAPITNQNLLPQALVLATWLALICVELLALRLIFWVWVHRKRGIVNAASPVFLIEMLIGLMLQTASIIPLTVDENFAVTTSQLNSACMLFPWLLVIGFLLVYGPLLAKSYRIYRIFNNSKMSRVRINNRFLIKAQLLGAIPVIGLMVFWQLYDPMIWMRIVISTDDLTGFAFASIGICRARDLRPTLVPILALLLFALILGVIFAWLNRSAPTEFSEGRFVSANIVVLAEALILGIPIIVLSETDPLASFIIKTLFVLLTVLFTLAIFFWPKVALVHGFWEEDSSTTFGAQGSSKKNGNDAPGPSSPRGSYVSSQSKRASLQPGGNWQRPGSPLGVPSTVAEASESPQHSEQQVVTVVDSVVSANMGFRNPMRESFHLQDSGLFAKKLGKEYGISTIDGGVGERLKQPKSPNNTAQSAVDSIVE